METVMNKPYLTLLATILVLITCNLLFVRDCQAQPEKIDMASRAEQLKDLRFGMFICWSFSSFSGKEWTRNVEDVSLFNPTGFDPDQWVRTAKEAEMGYVLFLAKHHDGFCLWDTKTTDLKVTKSPLGVDVLAEVKKACDKYDIKLAVYFSEGDWSWSRRKDIPPSQSPPEMKKAQLKELLTQYGPVEFIWFDYAIGDGGLSHEETTKFVTSLQPDCYCGYNVGELSGRLALRERGQAGPIGGENVFDTSHLKGRKKENYSGFKVAEFTYPISNKYWFYQPQLKDHDYHSPERIYNDYLGAVKYGNIFSLDVGPNRAGKLRDMDVKVLRQVGRYIRGEDEMPEKISVKGAKASSIWNDEYNAAAAIDGNERTRWGAGKGQTSGWLEIDLGAVKNVLAVSLNESGFGRVRAYRLESKIKGQWKTVHSGANIRDDSLVKFDAAVKTRFLRLSIDEATDTPTISEFIVFN